MTRALVVADKLAVTLDGADGEGTQLQDDVCALAVCTLREHADHPSALRSACRVLRRATTTPPARTSPCSATEEWRGAALRAGALPGLVHLLAREDLADDAALLEELAGALDNLARGGELS